MDRIGALQKGIDVLIAQDLSPEAQSRTLAAFAKEQLAAAQEQNGGWLTDELIAAVAKYLDLPPVWAYEVASFYSMFETKKVGRNNVAFCTNISCWLNGAQELVAHAEQKLGCKLGESSADGRVYLKKEEECVAACCGAPVVVINGHYHEKLTPAKVDELLDGLK